MLSGDSNKYSLKKSVGLISQKKKKKEKETTLNVQHTFYVHFFALCSLFFSLRFIFTLVTASISHILTAAINFHVFLPTKLISFVFYLCLSNPFSVIHVNVDIKIKSKKRMAFLLFSISKSPGGCAIYRQNARVLEMQNFTPAYMNG